MSKMKSKIEDICEMHHCSFTAFAIASLTNCTIDFVEYVIAEYYEVYY